MARHKFAKGVVTNPKGRPKDPPELHRMKQMSQGEFRALLYSMLMSPAGESMMPQDNELKAALACILIQAKKFGDPTRLEYFTNRLFGKVPDKIEVSPGEKLRELSDLELYEVAKEQIKELEKKLFNTEGKQIGSTRTKEE